MRTAQITRRQAESMLVGTGEDPAAVQEHRARFYERADIYGLLDEVDSELIAETNWTYEYRTPTEPAPVQTPWTRMSEAERERVRLRRRLRLVPTAATAEGQAAVLGEAA